MTFRRRIRELSREAQRPRIYRGRLAEDYDGIGQWVLVSLSQSSTTAAYKARVASGDFGTQQTFPAGTLVTISVYRGRLEVMSLGNKSQGGDGGGSVSGMVETLEIVIDGRGVVISTGIAGDHVQHWAGTLVGWTAAAGSTSSGSIQVDIWKANPSDHYPPVDGDSITGSDPITISSDDYNEDMAPSGWTVDLAEDDVLRFNVDSVSNFTRITIALKVTRN